MTETFSTLLASEGTLSSVYCHVDFKVYKMSKTLTTLLAGVRLLSSVNSHVVVKALFKSKTFTTVLATEKGLPNVDFKVFSFTETLSKPKGSKITSNYSSLLSFFSCGNLFSLFIL